MYQNIWASVDMVNGCFDKLGPFESETLVCGVLALPLRTTALQNAL
jgi:hypothetical protein